jgi:hypothetical protein
MCTACVRLPVALLIATVLLAGCSETRARPDYLFGAEPGSPTVAVNLLASTTASLPTDAFLHSGVPVEVRGSHMPTGTMVVVSARADNGSYDFFRYTRDVFSEETTFSIRVWANTQDVLESASRVRIQATLRGLDGRTLALDSAVVALR